MDKRATETDLRLKRLDDVIESGMANLKDPDLKDRIGSLKAIREQSRVDADRVSAMLDSAGPKASNAPMLRTFAQTAPQRMLQPGRGPRRDHLRALAQRIEVYDGGLQCDRIRTLAEAGGTGELRGAAPSFTEVAERVSNCRPG